MEGFTVLSQISNEVLVAVAVGLLVVLLAFFFVFKLAFPSRGNTILLTGPSDSGKTVLFFQLKEGEYVDSVPSMKENDAQFPIFGCSPSKVLHVVDIPGHNRLRQRVSEFLPIATAIVFVLDSTSISSSVHHVAEHLYDILTNRQVHNKKIPVLIACNKSDLTMAKSCEVVKEALLKEINKIRNTKTAMPSSQDDEMEEEQVFLGFEDEAFDFEQLPMNVTFEKCSAKTASIAAVKQFILEIVR